MKLTSADLRIGNIIKIKDTGEIVRICAITKHKVGFHAPNERPNAHLRYRRLHEIDGVRISNDYWTYTIKGREDRGVKKLTYIHELQNVYYALMGKEIKIFL